MAPAHQSALEPTKRSALAVANYLLQYAHRKGCRDMNRMRLNNLVYLAFGWWASAMDAALFREPIEAWKWGPAIPIVYLEFEYLGTKPIPVNYRATDDWDAEITKLDSYADAAKVRMALRHIWEAFGTYSDGRLLAITSASSTPWHQVFNGERGTQLDPVEIRKYFQRRLAC